MTNEFLAGVQGDYLAIMLPLPHRLTKEQALRLAAMLVLLADDRNEFESKYLAAAASCPPA